MSGLRALLEALAAEEATGRVTVKGGRPAVVLVEAGRIYGAERSDQPNLLIAMATAGLFTQEEWALALRLPTRDKWRALVDDDEQRFADLTRFARRYTSEVLTTLIADDVGTLSFSAHVRPHPFGPLATWTLSELVGPGAPAPEPAPFPDPDAYDRREFLEMLLEVSPLVDPQV